MSLLSAEPELAGRLAQGDPSAWEVLCETYGRALYLYAYHRTGDPSAAEDVRQETLLAAVVGIAGYRGEAPLFAWLCGIARRKAADELRRRGRQDLPLETADQETWQRLGREPLPDELVERAERTHFNTISPRPRVLFCKAKRRGSFVIRVMTVIE